MDGLRHATNFPLLAASQVIFIKEAKTAWDLDDTEAQMKDILLDIRHAQSRWDYVAAAHGGSFHSPVEIGRTISTGITIAQEGRIKLSRLLAELGMNEEIPYPDISTKEKAQKFFGLPMDELREEKAIFKQTLLPKWLEEARKREENWGISYN
jgi:nitrite reductase (cytochrome c-552)